MKRYIIGVIGTGESSPKTDKIAKEVGEEIARRGAILVNGGLGGVMEASAKGAKKNGGITIGILPGMDPSVANSFIDIPIPTGLGEIRNFLIVRSSQALIAINGGYGTLSEIAIALKLSRPVIGIETWDISSKIICADSPLDALNKALDAISNITNGK